MRSPFDKPFGLRSPFGPQSGAALSAAASLLATWADSNGGLATDPSDLIAKVIDPVTPANNFEGSPDDLFTTGRASIATYYNSSRIMQTAASGAIRWQSYDPATGALLGTLVEEARTNIALRATAIQTSPWAVDKVSVTGNVLAAPDGTTTAARMLETAASGVHNQYQAVTLVAATAYAFSVFAENGLDRDWVAIDAYDGAARRSYFDVTNGATGANAAGNTSAIISGGSGFYRCAAMRTAGGTGGYMQLHTATGNGEGFISFAGDITKGAYFWGAQIEAGGWASSFIPTAGTSVTREADSITLPTTSFNHSATAGTLFVEGVTAPGSGTQVLASLDDGTADERFRIVRDSSNNIRFIVTDGGVEQCNINLGTVANNTEFKVAASWSANDFAACLNGGTVGTDTGGTLPTVTTLRLGSSPAGEYWGGHIRPVMLLPIALADAGLQSVTS